MIKCLLFKCDDIFSYGIYLATIIVKMTLAWNNLTQADITNKWPTNFYEDENVVSMHSTSDESVISCDSYLEV